MNPNQIRRSSAWTDAPRIAAESGYVKTADIISLGMGQRRACFILTALVADGKLFPRKSGLHGNCIFYFPTEEAANDYAPAPLSTNAKRVQVTRAKPKEARRVKTEKPPEKPKAKEPRPKGLRPLSEQTKAMHWRSMKPQNTVKPTTCPSQKRDYLHQVLPTDRVPRVVDSNQCRGWARAATEKTPC